MKEFEQDIEKMFSAAANASEDTGEGDVGGDKKVEVKSSKNIEKKSETIVNEPKAEDKLTKTSMKEKAPIENNSSIKEKKRNIDPPNITNESTFSQERKPLINEQAGSASSEFVSENSIGRILEMNSTFNRFNDTEKEFVSGYFQVDSKRERENVVTKVIFGALTANQGDLNALNKIVEAKALDPAERAFFLMDQENYIIENVFEQVELLTGELGNDPNVTNVNKLNVCRKVEAVIAKMPKDVFAYIEKLQLFADKALDK